MYKGQEGTNVKLCNEFGNDPRKMCSKHKIIMKVDTRIRDIIIILLLYKV
jgi:hypothetical protein